KKSRRWRVAWRCTLPTGEIDSGSKSFVKDRKTAFKFKQHCNKNERRLKQTVFVDPVFLDDVFEEWKGYCLRYTPATQKLYIAEVGRFIDYLPEAVDYISDIQTIHVNQYINYQMGRGLANRSINNTLASIKSLCAYIHENYKIANPCEKIKKLTDDPPDHNFLTEEEYQKVLSNADDIAVPWVKFLAHTGLRASEFCRLQYKHCDLKERTITVIGKGRKRRTVGLNNTALTVLKDCKADRTIKGTDHVFLRSDGKPMDRHTVHHYVSKACRNAGLAGGGPHALRHYFATSLLLKDRAIIKVSLLLGHSSVTITQKIYSHILPSDLKGVTDVLDTS
ncbi:MAG: tyrosine-type recombinase/integrase, partial [Planctomycetota bacterium]